MKKSPLSLSANGAGDYGFFLVAIDGALPGGNGVDQLRIKIWTGPPTLLCMRTSPAMPTTQSSRRPLAAAAVQSFAN